MSKPYFYDDGTEILVERGALGLDPEFVFAPAEAAATAYDEAEVFYARELRNQREGRMLAQVPPLDPPAGTISIEEMRDILAAQYSSGPRAGHAHPVPKKPASGGHAPYSTMDGKALIEVIHYGRSHRYEYNAQLWKVLAPVWRAALIREGRHLLRSIQYQREIIENWKAGVVGDADERNAVQRYAAYYTASVVGAIHAVRNWWNDAQPATLQEYGDLELRTVNAWQNVTRSREVSYPILHELGIEYMRIRRKFAQLEARLFTDLEERTRSGKTGQDMGEFVESNAAALLEMYATLRAGGNASRLASYRLLILGVRAGFRSGSDYALAGNDGEKVIRNFADFVIPEAAGILADWLMGKATGMRRLVKDKENLTLRETIATELMKIALTLLFDAAIWYFYDRVCNAKSVDAFAKEQRKKLATSLVKSAIACFARRDTLKHPLKKMYIEKVTGAFEAAFDGLVAEYDALEKTAADEESDVVSVFLDDWKFHTMRFVGRFALALAKGTFVKQKASDWHELEERDRRRRAKAEGREEAKRRMGVRTEESSAGAASSQERQRVAREAADVEFEQVHKGLEQFHALLTELEAAQVMREADEQIRTSQELLREHEKLMQDTNAVFEHFEDAARRTAQRSGGGTGQASGGAEFSRSPLAVGVPPVPFPPVAVEKGAVDDSGGHVSVRPIGQRDLDVICGGALQPRGAIEREEARIRAEARARRKAAAKIAAIRAAREQRASA